MSFRVNAARLVQGSEEQASSLDYKFWGWFARANGQAAQTLTGWQAKMILSQLHSYHCVRFYKRRTMHGPQWTV